eukprot:39588_1
MGDVCCPGINDDPPRPEAEQQQLLESHTINPVAPRSSKHREITIHNQSNKALWVKIYNSRHDNPGENKVIIWSKFNSKGTKNTRITAWYYERLIDFGDDDIKNANKKTVRDRWPISPHENIFVFDGKYLFAKEYSSYNDIFNTRKLPPSSDGEYFILPAVFEKKKSLMVYKKNIVVQRIKHTPLEIFKLLKIGNMGYYNIISKKTKLIFTMSEIEDSTLCLVKRENDGDEKDEKNDENKKYNAKFKIETIGGSDNTFQIRSRRDAYVLKVNCHGNISTFPENIDDPGQRFFFQPAASVHT